MTDPDGADLLLTGASTVAETAPTRVLVRDGVIDAVGDIPPERAAYARTVDLSGHLLLPAAAEPHAHLDKTGLYAGNPPGDLAGAIAANRDRYPQTTPDDVRQRALASLAVAVRRGYTLVRSHVNVEPGIGTTALQALREVAREVAGQLELELTALVGFPLTGTDGEPNRALLQDALDLGLDVVGGAPALDSRPDEAVRWLVAAAADADRPVDLHLDETLDPRSTAVRTFAREVTARGLAGRAVASHCVSLGQQDEPVLAETARMLADAGITVVTLPQTNLVLQGSDHRTRVPRGTAPVRALREAGVRVAGGGDNWRDMFNPLGRIDPFETAALLVAVSHLAPAEAYECVSGHARAALGRAAGGLHPGAPADVLAVRAATVQEAVADATQERTVIHRGRVVARTRVVHEEVG